MKTFGLLLSYCLLCYGSHSQEPIDITDQTIRIGSMKEEELMFGFAAGDKIIFSFQETSKKDLKEIEVLEYPKSSKFSDYKVANAEKTFTVSRKGVYIFRFKNSAISGRVCRIRIQRIAASELTREFNTSVVWVEKQDTAWRSFTKDVITGYDTAYVQKKRKELVKVDTIVTPVFDKQLRVHSETALGKTPYTYASVQLPANTYAPNIWNPYESTEVINWSYWLGVGQKAKEDYDRANKEMAAGIRVLGALTGYGALASLAATGISLFNNPSLGDNVQFNFSCFMNNQKVILDYGNVVAASGRNEKVKQGSFAIELYNDNFREGIDVNLKIVVLQVHRRWEDVSYTETVITPRKEKQIITEPVVTTARVAMAGL